MGTMSRSLWATVAVLAVLGVLARASDPDPLQDFCVAVPLGQVLVNGALCKPSADVTAWDFRSDALTKMKLPKQKNLATVTPAFVAQFGGLNTLGIGAARIDFDEGDVNAPHIHPRATELLLVVKGELYVGFVSTDNTLYATTVKKGELFVFPRGLVHFQLNVGKGPALAFGALNSQNPGTQTIAPALFGAMPPIRDEVLEKGFRIDSKTVALIEKQFAK